MVLKKYFGDKAFYRMILTIAVPIMIQNGITNFVSLLDNIMVGNLGTEAMSGVSIVNQFVFIFNLLIFGAVSAAGIFTAQYHGIGNREGKMYTFRFKLLINTGAALLGIAVLVIFRERLISLFLHQGEANGDLVLTLRLSKNYLRIILIGLIPYSVSLCFYDARNRPDRCSHACKYRRGLYQFYIELHTYIRKVRDARSRRFRSRSSNGSIAVCGAYGFNCLGS